jgi:hypothetical protein
MSINYAPASTSLNENFIGFTVKRFIILTLTSSSLLLLIFYFLLCRRLYTMDSIPIAKVGNEWTLKIGTRIKVEIVVVMIYTSLLKKF